MIEPRPGPADPLLHKRVDGPTGTTTVGHEWDGIEELDTPMPRWWLWTLYATCAFALGYVILYPAIPLLDSATPGLLGWSSRQELVEATAREGVRQAPGRLAIARMPIERLPQDAVLMRAAVEGGRSAFKVHCVQCHGSGAAGSKGYANLNDDDWLWGGDIAAIHTTLVHGIRQPGNDETRMSLMPAFGRDEILTTKEIDDVVSHVRRLAGAQKLDAAAVRGAPLYATNCAVCHGDGGKGIRELGAPNLTDSITLYGGDRASLTHTIVNARNGVMPAWGQRLDKVTVTMLAAYVHSLGGGEVLATPAGVVLPVAAPEATAGAATLRK